MRWEGCSRPAIAGLARNRTSPRRRTNDPSELEPSHDENESQNEGQHGDPIPRTRSVSCTRRTKWSIPVEECLRTRGHRPDQNIASSVPDASPQATESAVAGRHPPGEPGGQSREHKHGLRNANTAQVRRSRRLRWYLGCILSEIISPAIHDSCVNV